RSPSPSPSRSPSPSPSRSAGRRAAMTTDVLDGVQVRAAQVLDVEPDDTGIVEVRIVPYEVEALLDDGLVEVFSRGAFAGAVGNPGRCKVTDQQHGRSVVIGAAVELRDEADGHYGRL